MDTYEHVIPLMREVQGTHHLHYPRGYNAHELLKVVEREALDQIEVRQNLGAIPYQHESK